MGIDAEMVVAAPQEITEDALRRLSYELCSAFGADHFWIEKKATEHRPAHHALTFALSWLDHLDWPEGTNSKFRVNVWGHFDLKCERRKNHRGHHLFSVIELDPKPPRRRGAYAFMVDET